MKTIACRLTPAELEVLDWLCVTRGYDSRSDCLRTLMFREAKNVGLEKAELAQVVDQRKSRRRRVSGEVIILRRRVGADKKETKSG